MGLIDLTTDLKSLKFGKDRPFGGSSNQPYITKRIPDGLTPKSRDFLLRNGFLNPLDSATDVIRLTRYFTDLTSPAGVLFTIKQNQLSQTSVRPKGIISPINAKLYNPLATIAQAGLVSTGTHLDKQGVAGGVIEPRGLGQDYTSGIKRELLLGTPSANRLVGLYDTKIENNPGGLFATQNNIAPAQGELLRYTGGPGATLGIGYTVLRFAGNNDGGTLRTGTNNPTIKKGIQNGFTVGKTASIDYIKVLGATYEYDATSSTNTNIINDTLQGTSLDPRFNEPLYKVDNNGIIIGPIGPILSTTRTPGKKVAAALALNASNVNTSAITLLSTTYQFNPGTRGSEIIYNKTNSGSLMLGIAGPELSSQASTKIKAVQAVLAQNKTATTKVGKDQKPISTYYKQGGLPTPNIYASGSTDPTPTINKAAYGKRDNTQGSAAQVVKNHQSLAGKASTQPKELSETYKGVFKFNTDLSKPLIYKQDTNPDGQVSKTTDRVNDNNTFTMGVSTLRNQVTFNNSGATVVEDFRKKIRDARGTTKPSDTSMAATQAPNYRTENIEQRVLLGDPGRRNKNLTNYVTGPSTVALDTINALPLYQSNAVTTDIKKKNDLVKFRIAAIDNTFPTLKEFIHFRAFIDDFSDSYQAEWSPVQYIGRGEKFYTYGGFGRTISLGWTVAAQSKPELIAMYKKLNFLASNLAPDYSGYGYMRGPLIQLTVGGYIYEQPGFITAMTLNIPQDSSWEIGINLEQGGYDPSVKELPHMIKVSGFSFTPIHSFIPRKQENTYDNKGALTQYGNQRYIALAGRNDSDLSNYATNVP